MKADLHTHTIHSKDSLTKPADLVAACVRRGVHTHRGLRRTQRPADLHGQGPWRCAGLRVDVLAVTDHNAIAGAREAHAAAEQLRAAGRPAPLVIVGEEVMTTAGEIIGLFLSDRIPRGLSPQETIERIRDQGGFVVLPHPFDRLRRGPLSIEALEAICPHIDAVEVRNARTTFPADNEHARAFAEEHGLLQTAGSDAHTTGEVGRCFVELEAFHGMESFRHALTRGIVGGQLSSPLVHLHSSYAKLRKRMSTPER